MFRATSLRASCLALALGLTAASLAGCATDNAASGPQLAQGGAGNGADGGSLGDAVGSDPDGAAIGPDGGSVPVDDASAVSDAVGPGAQDGGTVSVDVPVGPGADAGPIGGASCQGICGKFVKNAPCHCDNQCQQYGDCCGDYKQFCGTVGPGPQCGNQVCDPGETAQSCPMDCPVDPGQVVSCLADKCPSQMKECKVDAVCSKVIGCIEQCQTAQCAEGCTQGIDPKTLEKSLGAIGQCGQQQGCLQGGGPQPGVCGDGQCAPNESAASCPKDCGTTATPITQCLANNCKDAFSACLGNAGCQKVLDCASTCKDFNCLVACSQKVDFNVQQKFVLPLGQCGQNAGCFGGGTTKPVCGDGTCSGGETATSCPKDCKLPAANPVEQCFADKCTKAWATCSANKDCYAAAQCLEKGGSVMQCVKSFQIGQMLNGVVQCGNQNGCLGGTTPTASCQGKCGVYDPKATCQCDDVCSKMGNCCKDYTTFCSVAPSGCGDGKCDVAAGEPKTCPEDCGAPPVPTCQTKSDCASDEVCCAKPDGQVCVKLGQCM